MTLHYKIYTTATSSLDGRPATNEEIGSHMWHLSISPLIRTLFICLFLTYATSKDPKLSSGYNVKSILAISVWPWSSLIKGHSPTIGNVLDVSGTTLSHSYIGDPVSLIPVRAYNETRSENGTQDMKRTRWYAMLEVLLLTTVGDWFSPVCQPPCVGRRY
jgi:hypothetical protein